MGQYPKFNYFFVGAYFFVFDEKVKKKYFEHALLIYVFAVVFGTLVFLCLFEPGPAGPAAHPWVET